MSIKDFFKPKAPVTDAPLKTSAAPRDVETGEPDVKRKRQTDEIEELPSTPLEPGTREVSPDEMRAILAKTSTTPPALGTGPASIWQTNDAFTADLASPAFDPALMATTAGKPAQYALLSQGLKQIEATKHSGVGSKKKILVILTNLFRSLLFRHTKEELLAGIYLLINRLAPDFENLEIGVGDQIVTRTMAEVYGRSEAAIKQDLHEGRAEDLGEAALLSRVNQKMLFTPPPLTVQAVFKELMAIAKASGKDSQRLKKDVIKKLLVAAKEHEAKFIIRTLQGRLRVGIQNASVLSALAFAFSLTSKKRSDARESLTETSGKRGEVRMTTALESLMVAMEAAVRQAFCEVPDYGYLLNVLLDVGADPEAILQRCQVRVGVPVKPMLAKPTKAVTEVLDRFEGLAFTAEYKYDGERAQIHISSGSDGEPSVAIYSRNSENMTEKYPDVSRIIKEVVAKSKGRITDCVIDSEVVAFDTANNKILPFQTLSTRSRKNVKEEDIKIQVCLFPFDLIFLNGKSQVRETFRARRSQLHANFPEIPGRFQFAVHRDMNTSEEIEVFLTEAVDHNCEGLMLKTLDANASYEPSKRSLNWLKLKKDYVQGMGDSLDLVPIGAFYGKGKRTGVYGAYLLACFDAENGEFQTTCKIGTGFSDEDLATHYGFLKEHLIANKRADYDVTDKMYPDVWLDAVQVWEVAAADLSISPVHTAGRASADDGKGVGLRFPRFLRIRDDKGPEDATAAEQIINMYSAQFKDKGNAGAMDEDEDEE